MSTTCLSTCPGPLTRRRQPTTTPSAELAPHRASGGDGGVQCGLAEASGAGWVAESERCSLGGLRMGAAWVGKGLLRADWGRVEVGMARDGTDRLGESESSPESTKLGRLIGMICRNWSHAKLLKIKTVENTFLKFNSFSKTVENARLKFNSFKLFKKKTATR